MSGLAGGSRRPAAAFVRAAALCAALGLAACGDQGGQPPAGETGTTGAGAGTTGGAQSGAGGSSENSAGLAVIAGPSGPLDTTNWVAQPPFYAAGDEPAWRLEIADGWFSFKRSALRAIEEPMVAPVKDGAADVFQTGSLKIVIRREACQAGGQTSELAVDVTYADDTFSGCVFAAPAAGVATSPEATAVAGAVKVIDACLASLAQPGLVTGVVPRQDGAQTSVALRARNGTPYECGADTATAAIIYLDPIEVGAQAPWMTRMKFVREGVAVSAPCPDAEEVRAGEAVLGRMLSRTCKF